MTELLGEDDEPMQWARRINERGQVLAVDNREASFAYAGHTLWYRGEATRLELEGSPVPPDVPLLPDASDISERGHIVGAFAYVPFDWKDDVYVDLGFSLEEFIGDFMAVNDRGKVTGWLVDLSSEQDQPRAMVWHNGEITFAPIDAEEAMPTGINNRNQVLVTVPTEGDELTGPTVAVLWQVGGGVTELGGLSGTGVSQGIALNERGQVTGDSETAEGETHAFLWHRGRMTDLGTLGGARSTVGSVNSGSTWYITVGNASGPYGNPLPDDRQAMNEWGHVVGTSETAEGESHAFLWRHGEMHDLGTLGGPSSSAWAINNWGQVVGVSDTADGERHAFLWQNGKMTDLGAAAGAGSSAALDINDRGQIVGYVLNESGDRRAVMWTVER